METGRSKPLHGAENRPLVPQQDAGRLRADADVAYIVYDGVEGQGTKKCTGGRTSAFPNTSTRPEMWCTVPGPGTRNFFVGRVRITSNQSRCPTLLAF
eukprot:g19056.t1